MRDSYFTDNTIGKKAAQWKAELLAQFGRRRGFQFDPQRAALIVLDMQEFFCDPASHAYAPAVEPIIPGINRLIISFSAAGRPVFLTRHIQIKGEPNIMEQWWSDAIRATNPLSELTEKIEKKGCYVIQKSRYSAFFGTDLERCLKELNASQVVITGVLTHLCCETTARAAFLRDFEVYFTIDGTATYLEEFHKATLLNLAHGFAIPVTIEEILDEFKEER